MSRKKIKGLEHCSKNDLLKRIAEVIHRIKSPIPDVFIMNVRNKMSDYKTFIIEPFLLREYDHYNPKRNVI